MQFVRNGPDIPERLLQAHEDGNVVFFCGAGISYPARLPGFDGLVKTLYAELAPTPNPVQNAAIKAGQFDTAVGLLEAVIVGGRKEAIVRKQLASILSPNLGEKNATATHEALLELGKSRSGNTRLITTNFDRLFEQVIINKGLSVERFRAPLLPVPKNRWDGLVYLHGLLSETPTLSELDRLVVSSGDFGLAYLTERWAARFVAELFRSYTVCFVGYSINDPVLRYMMDALAADRLLGESFPEAFAFGNYPTGKFEKLTAEWYAKGVTPILYRNHSKHFYLHRTLWEWADTYRDGARGKEQVVVESAMARPLVSTEQDDFVGRLLWAVSDPSGLPAKRFAELDPVPSLDWLEPFSEDRYHREDLGRFGVLAGPKNRNGAFSLIRRPSPYHLAPPMNLVDAGLSGSDWDEVMTQIARWLTRHLNDPAMLLWLAKRGVQRHSNMVRCIEIRIRELRELARDSRNAELANIRKNAPNAIPGPQMQKLWHLLLSGLVKSATIDHDFYRWHDRFRCDGLTAPLRLELREMLAPRVLLREPFRWPGDDDQHPKPGGIDGLVRWEIVLSTAHVHSNIELLTDDENWNAALPELVPDFTALLRDVLELKHELGGVDRWSDHSYISQPSIGEHSQNKDFRDWTALIDLVRDAWLALVSLAPERARFEAERWRHTPYPLFRRLTFFAASHGSVISAEAALNWLLEDDHWWLWSVETEREVVRLLVALALKLDGSVLVDLEQAILSGPPRAMFAHAHSVDSGDWARIVDRKIWLRLARIDEATPVSDVAAKRLNLLSRKNPEWKLADDQRDEFPYWMGDGDEWREFISTPRYRRELVEWLKKHPSTDPWHEDRWRQRCSDNFATAACTLYALSIQDFWPVDRWREALQAWSEEKLAKQSWRYMAAVIAGMSDSTLQSLAHSVSWWIQSVAKTFQGHEQLFLTLAGRILAFNHKDGVETDDLTMRAINHPVGHITQALLYWWYRRHLEDEQGLPEELRSTFTRLCDTNIEKYRYGRVILASRTVTLFRVDREWTRNNLLSLFDWQNSESEARAVWAGFLWSPRLYRPLMNEIKSFFLDAASYYEGMGELSQQYASLLTFAALDPGDTFTNSELARATRTLPNRGLHESAQALVRGLEGAGDQRSDYWLNRVAPYLQKIWPKTQNCKSPELAETLSRLCIEAMGAFPDALRLLRAWLEPPVHLHYILHRLLESDLCSRFPESALDFLHLLIGGQSQWGLRELAGCLRAIKKADVSLGADQRFRALVDTARRSGLEINE